MLREGAAKRPGVLTKVGMKTFVDPDLEGCAMNEAARGQPIVSRQSFDGEDWLYFRSIKPDVAIIRASTSDERGNLSFEQEGAYLGAMEMALAARNSGGIVIAQVRRVAMNGSIRPHDVRVPGILVDHVVEAPFLEPGDEGVGVLLDGVAAGLVPPLAARHVALHLGVGQGPHADPGRLGVHEDGDRGETHRTCGPHDPDRDLAPVCDQ